MAQRNILLMTTLGHRDILLDEQPLPRDPFRTTCQELPDTVKRDPSCWNRIRFPLLERFLQWIRTLDGPDAPLALRDLHLSVYFIATDQRGGRFAETDTVALAALAEEWVKRRQEAFGALRVRRWTFEGNPAAFDETLSFFRKLAAEGAVPSIDAPTHVLVHVTSGTPALVFGTLVGLAPVLPRSTLVLVLPPGADSPLPFALLPELERLQSLRDAALALEHWNPALAAAFLERAGAPSPFQQMLRALALRLQFDFERALRLLEREVLPHGAFPELRRLAEEETRYLQALVQAVECIRAAETPPPEPYRGLLAELWQSAKIAWSRNDAATFLATLFRFQEAVLRWATEHTLGLPTGSRREGGKVVSLPAYQERLAHDPVFREVTNRNGIDPVRPPSRDTLYALLSVAAERGDPLAQRVLDACRPIDALAGLRNASIVGHGFEPVSREAIADRLRETQQRSDPETLLDELARAAGIDTATVPLEALRTNLLQLLEQLQVRPT